MSKYIQVAEDENEESMEVPIEEDRTLLLSTLNAQFPGSCGLKYRNPDSGAMRGIRLSDGRLYPPDGEWSNRVYLAVFPKGLFMSHSTKHANRYGSNFGVTFDNC